MYGEKESPDSGERKGKHVRIVFIIIGLVVVAACAFWLLVDLRSAEERLAEIEAARVIPDAENAATIYNELLQDPSTRSLDSSFADMLYDSAFEQTLNHVLARPWQTEEYPEIAAWIAKYADIIDRLVEASHRDQCRFPISLKGLADLDRTHREGAMMSWDALLYCAMNNDLGDRRIDDAIAKWRCLIQMENHLHQHPWPYGLAGGGDEAAESIIRFIVMEDPSDAYLRQIEALPLPVANDWAQYYQEVRFVQDLRARKERESLGLWEQIRLRYSSYRLEPKLRNLRESYDPSTKYLRFLAGARAVRILVAAKRYVYETGHWPDNLDELKSSLSSEILTDPLSDSPFVYRPVADSFKMYCRGRNQIDEDGKPVEGSDDWPIWPPRGTVSQDKQQDANDV